MIAFFGLKAKPTMVYPDDSFGIQAETCSSCKQKVFTSKV
jgi:hypothetical protein